MLGGFKLKTVAVLLLAVIGSFQILLLFISEPSLSPNAPKELNMDLQERPQGNTKNPDAYPELWAECERLLLELRKVIQRSPRQPANVSQIRHFRSQGVSS